MPQISVKGGTVKKKLMFIIPTLGYGGGEKVAITLAKGILKTSTDYEVTILNYFKRCDYPINKSIRIRNLRLSNGKFLIARLIVFIKRVIKTYAFIKSHNPDVVVSFMINTNILTMIALTLLRRNIKVVLTEHNVRGPREARLFEKYITNFMTRHLYKKADQIIAVSEGVKNELETLIPNEQILVIDNPIDVENLKNLSLEEIPKLLKNKNYILGVGRLSRAKGVDLLIEAFYIITNNISGLHLVIVGDGEEMQNLKKLAETYHLQDKIYFLGFQDNPYKFMKNTKCFVLSSRWEGFGLVLAEALICGAKVVSFDCKSGPRRILENGKYGKLVECFDVKKLAESIKSTLELREDKEAIHFSYDENSEIIRKYLRVIESN